MKTVQICERGECGGECYRCRLAAMERRAITAEADLQQLREAVDEMRHAQKQFFRCRTLQAMHVARRAEKHVDDLLAPRLF